MNRKVFLMLNASVIVKAWTPTSDQWVSTYFNTSMMGV